MSCLNCPLFILEKSLIQGPDGQRNTFKHNLTNQAQVPFGVVFDRNSFYNGPPGMYQKRYTVYAEYFAVVSFSQILQLTELNYFHFLIFLYKVNANPMNLLKYTPANFLLEVKSQKYCI